MGKSSKCTKGVFKLLAINSNWTSAVQVGFTKAWLVRHANFNAELRKETRHLFLSFLRKAARANWRGTNLNGLFCVIIYKWGNKKKEGMASSALY